MKSRRLGKGRALGYHVVQSAFRFYRIPNNTTNYRGRTVLGYEAAEGLPAWVPPEREVADRDEQLRLLVDLLPAEQAHVISRVFFGQSTLKDAAADVGITPAQASLYQKRGLETLKGWLADPETVPVAPHIAAPVKVPKSERCFQWTDWGQCHQPMADEGLCALHWEMAERSLTPDPVYHRKVVLGEIEPIQAKLSKSEMNATVSGRYKGDGRRLDAYTGFDPIEIDP